jgi:2-polyprenyl-3-methyl-5-hydroxy-6-metoxy-1,4-benzoquinol methylase
MGCCKSDCAATARHFDDVMAEKDLERYRKSGPDPTTGRLLSALRQRDLSKATLLDVGGGIGIVSFELLASGVSSATLVDTSPSYIRKAEAEALRRGLRSRLDPVLGDFVAIGHQLRDADIVVMDRVVCCYPDYESLLDQALRRCRALFALSYPRGRWYVRVMTWLENTMRRIKKNDFRTFVHPPGELARIIEEAGFRPVSCERSWVWSCDLYAAPDAWGRLGQAPTLG